MKKETQKEKIVRLEGEILELQETLKDYMRYLEESNQIINNLKEQADVGFANSSYKKQLENSLFIAEENAKVQKNLKKQAEARCIAKDKYIQELKNENEKLNIKLTNKICEKHDLADEIHELKRQLEIAEHFNNENNIRQLTLRSTKQEEQIEELKRQLESSIPVKKNTRGAGRKSKLDDKKDEIKQLRAEGMKIQELANRYNCSVGKIHKLISE